MTVTALAERPTGTPASPAVTSDQLDLVRRTVANGATPQELQLYLYDCQRQGVHPLDRLLHFTKRGGKYTPVTSIDLMRIRAAETGEYAGSDDAEFRAGYVSPAAFQRGEQADNPGSATVTVWRLVQGQRYAFTATARWEEYYPGEQSGHMWRKMPYTMLGKCAEALALRKGFPRQLAGLYAKEELDQADKAATTSFVVEAPTETNRHPQDVGQVTAAGVVDIPPDTTPQIERELPSGAVLIKKVEAQPGKPRGTSTRTGSGNPSPSTRINS